MNHPGAQNFQPAGSRANPAALAAAHNTQDIDLGTGFSKGKKPQDEILKFLGQIADIEIVNPPFLTVWRNGIRYFLSSEDSK